MELNHFRYFYHVAREGGFTKASKILRVQQPVISKMVQTLEDELGLILFERHKRGVTLTKAGDEIFRHCERIFSTVEEIRTFAETERTECQGPLPFAATESVVMHLIPPLMKDFLKAHPKVKPHVFSGNSSQIIAELLANRAEFGLFFVAPEDEQAFEIVTLAPVRHCLVISPKAAEVPLLRKSFISARHIDYPKATIAKETLLLKRFGADPEPRIFCNNFEAQKQMALDGLGFTFLPWFMVKKDVTAKRLIVLPQPADLTQTLRLVTRKNKVLSRNSRTLIELIKAELPDLLV